MSSILTNTSAMVALQTMKGINANLNKTQADISTGKSVATAKDNAYWRAKEGEIARTLLAMPEVKAARVHIASAPTRAFQPEAKPTASVTLTTVSGTLTEAQARAIRHLVASAVAGLTPDAVQIIDTVAGLIGGEDTQAFDIGDAEDMAVPLAAAIGAHDDLVAAERRRRVDDHDEDGGPRRGAARARHGAPPRSRECRRHG